MQLGLLDGMVDADSGNEDEDKDGLVLDAILEWALRNSNLLIFNDVC
jgi:hypothetical protein